MRFSAARKFVARHPGPVSVFVAILLLLYVTATVPFAGAAISLDNSLRFNDDDSAYLSKTYGSTGDRTTWTVSTWVKRSGLGAGNNIAFFGNNTNGFNLFRFSFDSTDALRIRVLDGSASVKTDKTTSALFRDPAKWNHVVLVWDTNNATAEDRVRIYVDGTRLTSFSSNTNPNSGATSNWNDVIASHEHEIGGEFSGSLNAYLSDFHFIDGQALSPSDFGETDSNGYWRPKAYSGSYGTNGFHLDFADGSDLGNDVSGNANDWTSNNLDATDQVIDTPTSGFATMHSLVTPATMTLNQGNLELSGYTAFSSAFGNIGVDSGKWYWEMYARGSDAMTGIDQTPLGSDYPGGEADSWGWDGNFLYNNNAGSAYGVSTPFVDGDVISVALDMDAGTLVFYKNGSSQGTAASGLSDTFFPTFRNNFGGTQASRVNFGQSSQPTSTATALPYRSSAGGYFLYDPPSGYKALSTANLPEPDVVVPKNYFDAKTYTGNGSTQSITGLSFQPDLVWLKDRTSANSHGLFDAVRGVTQWLASNLTQAETTDADTLTAFDTSGLSLGADAKFNTNSNSYVSWNWKESPTSGFDIVSFVGNGTAGRTVSHSLDVAPDFMIFKNRDNTEQWIVYHSANTSAPETDYLLLNSTAATADSDGAWNDTAPTGSIVTLGGGGFGTNVSGNNMIAYLFAEKGGFSKFGSYTGNGSADGPFVYTGFKPRWVLIKNALRAGERWMVFDTARQTYNGHLIDELRPNTSDAEGTGIGYLDYLANGFKLRSNASSANNFNGDTYIYAAFAEQPLKYSAAEGASSGGGGGGPGITFTGNVRFLGNLIIEGALSKGAGTFVIDHPQKPGTHLLYHSFVESPDAKNIYDGIATLDQNGEARIFLPEYFEALNEEFRYQWLAMHQPMPGLYIKEEVHDNQFVIAGGPPGGKVSWQVTGIRHDPYIERNPIKVEVEKGPNQEVDKGECLFEPSCQ
jgi:hypothetical protein